MKPYPFNNVYEFVLETFPLWEQAVVFEIGAHKGTDTKRLAEALKPPYHYFCFEPDNRNLPDLTAVAKAIGKQVEVYPRAVCEKSGTAPFHFSAGRAVTHAADYVHTDSGSLMEPGGIHFRYPWMEFFDGWVRTISIDDFCAYKGIVSIDFMWADVQGAELRVLAGARRMIQNTHYLYTECYRSTTLYIDQPRYDDLVKCLGAGWETLLRTETDVLFQNMNWEGAE